MSETPSWAQLRCGRCGYEWLPRQLVVKMCPACKSRKWNQPKFSRKPMTKKVAG